MSVSVVGSTVLADITFYVNEVSTAATGAVAVVVTNLAGTTVSSGSATHVGTAGNYTFDCGIPTTPDVYRVAWSGVFAGATQAATSIYNIVGARYVAIAEIRALNNTGSRAGPYADTTKWPIGLLVDARDLAEAEAELIMARSFVTRAVKERVVARSDGMLRLSWPHIRTVRSATTVRNATVLDVTGWVVDGVVSNRIDTYGSVPDGWQVDVIVEYGETTVPSDVRAAVGQRCGHMLAERASNQPATTERYVVAADGQSYGLARPTARSTANGSVDAVYGRYSLRTAVA